MSGRQRVNGPVRALAVAAAFGFALTLTGAASAQPVEIALPADPVSRAAFDVLDKHCARCHQDGKLTARERPSKNFGNVLKLDEIASNVIRTSKMIRHAYGLLKDTCESAYPHYTQRSIPGERPIPRAAPLPMQG